MNTPKVQIVCITYKHEKFIAEALESFVRQKTNFPFEVLIGNDCSPDGTDAIVQEYVQRYPDIIRNIPRERNMGPTQNLVDLCKRCTAPYIAFCEGDDYWVDDYKLQKQFDFMESHPDASFCFTKTRILFPENWGIIDWYKPVKGEILIPDSVPGFKAKQWFRAQDMVNVMPAQTSSYFFRWNYKIELPEWFHGGVVGDFPMLMIQLGKGKAGFIPEVTSVYRRSEVGVFMTVDKRDHFIQTRKEYVRFLYGLREYFREHYDSVAVPQLDQRLKREITNLIGACNSMGDYGALEEVLQKYPGAMQLGMTSLLNVWKDHQRMIDRYSWEGYKAVACTTATMKKLAPLVIKVRNECVQEEQIRKQQAEKKKRRNWWKHHISDPFLFDSEFYLRRYPDVRKAKVNPRHHYFHCGWKEGRRPYPEGTRILRQLQEWFYFWFGAVIPKKKNRWVFSSFFKKGYVDNTKYMYEYVVKHHPEIEAMWLTMDVATFSQLKEAGMPVRLMNKSRWYTMRAALAFTDHYVRSDYKNEYGYNIGTKVVQLWHGVGLKNMQPIGDTIPSTTISGVRLSSDLYPMQDDSWWTRIKKKLRFICKAPYRELHEKYYGFVCPGWEHVKYLVDVWRVPRSACIFAGHPRNIHLHSSGIPKSNKILYAPTFRWDPKDEREMIDRFLSSLPQIGEFLESINGELVLRLHPHTWRNYEQMIQDGIKGYARITKDTVKDVYTTIGDYAIMISDYSSIAFDFVLLNRPIVFFVPDRETYMNKDVSFNYPFDEYTPGPKVSTWSDVISSLKEYITNPQKDEEWRRKVQAEFYDMSVNDARNSGRIVDELKKRLKIK